MFETFFDSDNHDGFIQKGDVVALAEKFRLYRNLKEEDKRHLRMLDILYAFYDCLMEQVKNEQVRSDFAQGFDSWAEALQPHSINSDNISLNQWLNMWGKLCHGAAGISGFPIWVQLLGHLFFDTIDRDGDGICSIEELQNFYKDVIGVDGDSLTKVTTEGYRALTAGNKYKLNKDNYLYCFASFLLGRNIYGPGKYIFGVFDTREMDETYKVIYNDGEDENDF